MTKEEKKAVDFIKDSIFEYEEIDNDVLENIDRCHKALSKLIKTQQKEIDELHNEINQRIKLKIENEHIVDTQFIHKSKIEKKIKEIEEYRNSGCMSVIQDFRTEGQIDTLKELLESEE